MKLQKRLIFLVVLALIGGTAGAIVWLKAHRRLGQPGIRATPTGEGVVMDIRLPERVLDFTSTNVPQSSTVLGYLPKDTSYAQRFYQDTNGFGVNANIILMGADRTSIHKPDYCLPGQGWRINQKTEVDIPIEGPQPYTLRVAKWVIGNAVQQPDGTAQAISGLYVFWFVADNEQTANNDQRLWWLARDLFRTGGVLQRWAYVSYFAICSPGREEQAFDRMKQLIAASVPEFQLPPKSAGAAIAEQQ